MEQAEVDQIKFKTTTSIVYLTLRNIGIQAISMAGFFILTVLLGTGEIGLFAIVAESVSILGYFSDVGLAPTLIQQKTPPSLKQLRTTFFIQQILVFIALILVSIIYPRISQLQNYGTKELWITISLCFSFLVASLKTIPSILLERDLNFKILSTIDIIENVTFYICAVYFAFMGYGGYSYAIATFIRSLLGLIIIYYLAPWSIGISFSWSTTKDLFRHGIPFQLNSFIAMAKDRMSNVIVAGIIGRESFGLLAWAQKGPRLPLSFMDAIMKVTFPTFSRIQDDPSLLTKSISRSIFYISLVIFPILAGISIVAPNIVQIIPKYAKWVPALLPMYFFALNSAIAAVTTPLTNAFNAVGKIAITTKLMIMWTILTWIFYPILSIWYGYLGTSIASLIVGLSSFVVWYIASNLFVINIPQIIFHPTVASVLIIGAGISINQLNLLPLPALIIKTVIGIVVYCVYHFLFSKTEINWFLKHLQWTKNNR